MSVLKIAEANYNKLVKSALQVVSDKDKAKEVVHEAILKVHKKYEKGDLQDTYLLTYLHHTCRTVAIDMYCRTPVKRVKIDYVEGIEDYDHIDNNKYTEAPDIYFKLCIQLLEKNTEPIDVAIFKYRYYSNLSIKDMAKLSGFSYNLIYNSIQKTNKLIKENLNYDLYVKLKEHE